MRCRHHSCLLGLRGNGGGGGGDADDATDDDDDDASFQWRFIGSICKALMEPPTLETGSSSFYSPRHSYHRTLFCVQFFFFFYSTISRKLMLVAPSYYYYWFLSLVGSC